MQQNGFKCRKTTGKLIFAMVTCRADISLSVLNLSQYNNSPVQCHVEAFKNVYQYLHATLRHGNTFCRLQPNRIPPLMNLPPIDDSAYNIFIPPENAHADVAYCYTDSDWANDSTTRKSVGGIDIMFGGGSVAYKSILQFTITLSSTEAEFYALVESGKLVLYI